ncbi:MAG: fibrobacter succinogenes major paralogous domain-containing protein [Bacteroidales bacterium]|nr:fibrobacter succinogenes major paralogous domain-containing protein [Bacteroidales bacterium]
MKIKVLDLTSIFLLGILLISSCSPDESEDEVDPSPVEIEGQMTDSRDGQIYETIEVGSQTWMAENFNYDPGSGSWVYDDVTSNGNTYGRLYDWETACEVCPDGWHLPTNPEWGELVDYLGGMSVAGGKLKETGIVHWESPNTGATDEVGFKALPSGFRDIQGDYLNLGKYAQFWTSTQFSTPEAAYVVIKYNGEDLDNYSADKLFVLAVRCVKD